MDVDQLPLVTAADGMPVRPLSTHANALMSVAIGFLAPGTTFATHFHPSLEQLTIGMKGRVVVTMQDTNDPQPVVRELRNGGIVTTPANATLSFANPFDEPAEIMFVCSPPFPGEGEGAVIVARHGPRHSQSLN